ncbi:dihydropteroate synthase [Moorella naiadis]|uniref:dihydropteroate synthase n=1 Tax=Moorella naiadis (nom. illeg.) TaxID=3093670 RepID=UPI003D9CBCE4
MLVIGERMNTAGKTFYNAVLNRDVDFVLNLARRQIEAGADYLDLNTGHLAEEEGPALRWLRDLLVSNFQIPLCFDSANPDILEDILKDYDGSAIINSISLEEKKRKALLPVLRSYPVKIVALCLDDAGIPESTARRLEIADLLICYLVDNSISLERIFIDPLILAIGAANNAGAMALETIHRIKDKYPGINTICGLSNISFGLPGRQIINRAFLAMSLSAGLDAAILDPLDQYMMVTIAACEALLGRDPYCRKYLKAYRKTEEAGK